MGDVKHYVGIFLHERSLGLDVHDNGLSHGLNYFWHVTAISYIAMTTVLVIFNFLFSMQKGIFINSIQPNWIAINHGKELIS